MKRHVQIAKARAFRKRERSEFEILEAYVNTGFWDPGPFMAYAKRVDFSVSTADHPPPPIAAAKARLRYLSNRRWAKSRDEKPLKPILERSPREEATPRNYEPESLLVLPGAAPAGPPGPPPGMQAPVAGAVQAPEPLQPAEEEAPWPANVSGS